MIFPEEAFKSLKEISNYMNEDNDELQEHLLNSAIEKTSTDVKHIERDDITLMRLIKKIYHYGYISDSQKSEFIKKLEKLHSILNSLKTGVVKDSDEYIRLELVLKEVQELVTHQKNYLYYKPGAGSRDYIRLIDLTRSPEKKLVTNKALLELKGGRVIYNGKEIQGVKLALGRVEIVGQHYSSKDVIARIVSDKELSSSNERYCYIAEAGKLGNKSERQIRKMMGAASAEANVIIKVDVPLHLCWIRVKRGEPAKFAVEARNVPVAAPKPQKGFRIEVNNEVRWAA